ncbi:hypothetical protein EXN66_Car010208 [Channa argus]|uniref:Uncharacterized protein n=1 Tax=Channa argus TaxID=215402 RepID=A0A6G1PW98_CHAAH|nr:hypothetical protein EXN66_Car010208 [Channa argus]
MKVLFKNGHPHVHRHSVKVPQATQMYFSSIFKPKPQPFTHFFQGVFFLSPNHMWL